MNTKKDKQEEDIGNYSVGNPALGLSDAVVGTYGPITRPGQCEMEGEGDGPISGAPTYGSRWPKNPNAPTPGCCCGSASGYLIEEAEIVL